jgi:trans-aconitate 2-methyltransferase
MRETAAKGPWAAKLAGVREARKLLPAPEIYYDRLRPHCRSFELWHTTYHHVLENPAAIVEWMTGSGLRPYLALLDTAEKRDFLEAYAAAVASVYPALADGRVMLHFPRFFFVAVRT